MQAIPLENAFRYCPRCGVKSDGPVAPPFCCVACEFSFFFNPVCAVGGVIANEQGEVLLLQRARDPGKGKLGLPGGFVDADEGAEDALIREIREEVNLEVESLEYLASFPNRYAYRGVSVSVTDVFFECRITSWSAMRREASEVTRTLLRRIDPEILERMAFDSNRRALQTYLKRIERP